MEILRKGAKKTLTLVITDEELSNLSDFTSPDVPSDMHFEVLGDDALTRELHLQLQGLQKHLQGSLKQQMEQLKKDLESMGGNIRGQIKGSYHAIAREAARTI